MVDTPGTGFVDVLDMWLTFLLTFAAGAAVPDDPGYRAVFHHQQCARWLLRRKTELRRAVLANVDPVRTLGVQRAPVLVAHDDPGLEHSPQFLWFTSDPAEDKAVVSRRIAEALAARAAGAVPRGLVLAPLPPGPDQPLSAIERGSLGIDHAGEVSPRTLTGTLTRTAQGLHARWFVGGRPAGGFELTSPAVELGYLNTVYEWQWEMLAARQRRNVPLAQKPWTLNVADFMENEIRAMFTRVDGERRFGYFYRVYDVPGGTPVHQLEVCAVRACERLAEARHEIVFPRRADATPGRLNLRLSDLGLRLSLTSIRASE